MRAVEPRGSKPKRGVRIESGKRSDRMRCEHVVEMCARRVRHWYHASPPPLTDPIVHTARLPSHDCTARVAEVDANEDHIVAVIEGTCVDALGLVHAKVLPQKNELTFSSYVSHLRHRYPHPVPHMWTWLQTVPPRMKGMDRGVRSRRPMAAFPPPPPPPPHHHRAGASWPQAAFSSSESSSAAVERLATSKMWLWTPHNAGRAPAAVSCATSYRLRSAPAATRSFWTAQPRTQPSTSARASRERRCRWPCTFDMYSRLSASRASRLSVKRRIGTSGEGPA